MFREKLKEIMDLRGLSVYDLARISNVSVSGIYDLLNGKNTDPRATTIENLSKALGISPNYFFEEHTMGPAALLERLSPEEQALVLSKEFLPFITLGREAIESGVPAEQLKLALKAILYNASNK
jgi:transcriptional regulator with XRE-family HTH domain